MRKSNAQMDNSHSREHSRAQLQPYNESVDEYENPAGYKKGHMDA